MVSIVHLTVCGHAGIDAHLNESQKVDANTSVYDKMVASLSVETQNEFASELVMA